MKIGDFLRKRSSKSVQFPVEVFMDEINLVIMFKFEFGDGDKTLKWEVWMKWTIKIFDARMDQNERHDIRILHQNFNAFQSYILIFID